MNLISLNVLDLSMAAILVVALAVLAWWMKLGLGARLIIAGVRTTVQLLLIGLVLKILFQYTGLLWVSLLAMIMLLVAAYEVLARQQRRFRGWWGYGLGALSMFISSVTLTVFALFVIIGIEPWYTPRYAIPLLGMMLGNTMTGTALALDTLTRSAWEQRMVIETRLALGQDWCEAIGDCVRQSVRVGLTPIINAMAAAGIVSLPGMMTGQILAGTPPVEAVKYQILIMFLIGAGTGFAAIVGAWFGARRLFDERQRLRLERLSDHRA